MSVSLRALGVAALCLTPITAFADDPLRTISVTGVGEITLPADQAVVRVGVQSGGETSAEAMNAASDATAAILAFLTQAGIAPTDVQTQGLRLTPVYKRGLAGLDYTQISGYSAQNSVSITTQDLNGLGGLIAGIVELGGNRIDGISFGLADPDSYQDQARVLAVQDARARADLYAGAAGVEVDGVISISENGYSGGVMYDAMPRMMMAESAVSDVPLAAGEITVTADVSIVFEIGD